MFSIIKKIINNPYKILSWMITGTPIGKVLSDKVYLGIKYRSTFGKKINWNNPKTFNEKLQWLKLYNRVSEYTMLVDKYEVKKYVSDIIGEEYIIPTLGIWDNFDDIDFATLPEQFVLKCTHDSGGIVVCKNKNELNINEIREKIEGCLSKNFYYFSREWPYKNVQPRILIEEYMEDFKDKELRDYKFYCFNGVPHYMLLATNRQSEKEELCFDYFDMDFNHLDLTNYWHPQAKIMPHQPEKFTQMKEFASILSQGIPHVRVDFYEMNGHIYFGEYTFFDNGGFLKICPVEWELEWGDLINLSNEI